MTNFFDRAEAGRLLASRLKNYRSKAVIYALPRGGVATGAVMRDLLNCPLDLIMARKIGHPTSPEYAIGAVTEKGPVIWNQAETAQLDKDWLKRVEHEARSEATRRRLSYLKDRRPVPIKDKTAIIVDDGIATGLTVKAAIAELKLRQPKAIIVAVPVAPTDTLQSLKDQLNGVIVLIDPNKFLGSVGAHYQHFPQLTDAEVIRLLK